jgi:hypothetical protein
MTVDRLEKTIKHVWLEPKRVAQVEAPAPWFDAEAEAIDFDWWEPRYDQPWRRQYARDREAFGGAHVAGPSAPVEGPNNPNRLRRELELEERHLAEAEGESLEVAEEIDRASGRIAWLRGRLEAA